MDNVQLVQRAEPEDHLDKDFPDVSLSKLSALLREINYFIMQVPTIDILHDYIE